MSDAPSAAEVGEALGRVLARPEFAERSAPALLRLLSDAWRGFLRWLGSLLSRIVPEQWSPLFTILLAAALAAAAVWLLVRILESRADAPARRGVMPGGPTSGTEPSTDFDWWVSAARSAAAQGRYRDAAAALYMAVLLRLDQRGVLRVHAAKTPGDYRREARAAAAPAVRAGFDAFIRGYLPVAFAPAAPGADAFEALRARAAELDVHA